MIRHCAILLLFCWIQSPLQAQDIAKLRHQLQAKSPSTRIAALRTWAKKEADLRVADPLLALLHAPEPEVRREALRTWVHIADNYSVAVYFAHCPRERGTREQYMAATETQQRWQKKFLTSVQACASDKEQSVRKEAVRTLARLSSHLEIVFPDYEPICGTGIEFFISYQADDYLTALAKQKPSLLFSLIKEHDPVIVFGVSGSLAYVKYKPVYPVLLQFLKSPEITWRLIGCHWLGHQEPSAPEIQPFHTEIQNALHQLVNDPSPVVREKVSGSLRQYCSKQVPLWATQLMMQLIEDKESKVRVAALYHLRKPQDPQLRQEVDTTLQRLSKSPDPDIAHAAKTAQERFASPDENAPMP